MPSMGIFHLFCLRDDKKITWSEGAVPPTVTHACQKWQS